MNASAPESPSGASNQLLDFARRRSPKIEWLLLGATAARGIYQWSKLRREGTRYTTMRFSSRDASYYWLLKWLEQIPRQENLSVFRVLSDDAVGGECGLEPCAPGVSNLPRRPIWMVPTEGVKFYFRGVSCELSKDVPASGPTDLKRWSEETLVLRVASRDQTFCADLLEEIRVKGTLEKLRYIPKVYVWQQYRGWTPVRPCPSRRAAILPEGQYDWLLADIRKFLVGQNWYVETGVPYRRGYLLHGIPGSGKTTVVLALAGELKMNVCVVNLSGVDDAILLEAMRSLPDSSIVLFEDIDCAWSADRQQNGETHLTLSGLLNVLDGAATPDGRLTFLTTNHRDKLDPALLRPGRVDQEREFNFATPHQIKELAGRFADGRTGTGDQTVSSWAAEQISMATVQERLIQRYRK